MRRNVTDAQIGPPQLSEPNKITKHYDLLFEIGVHGVGHTFGVSRDVLKASSPRFANILRSGTEIERAHQQTWLSVFLRDGQEVLRIETQDFWGYEQDFVTRPAFSRSMPVPRYDPALKDVVFHMTELVLNALHGRGEELPAVIDIELVARILAFATEMKLMPALRTFFELWVETLDIPIVEPTNLIPWLTAAYFLKDVRAFEMLCSRAMWNMVVSIVPEVLVVEPRTPYKLQDLICMFLVLIYEHRLLTAGSKSS